MYADKMTDSMQVAIDETNRRRGIQQAYNVEHGIVPKTILKSRERIMGQTKVADSKKNAKVYTENLDMDNGVAADPVVQYLSKEKLEKLIAQTQKRMEAAAKDLNFMEAARLRDEWQGMKNRVVELNRGVG
jgi:excinuclease ABC subunit B